MIKLLIRIFAGGSGTIEMAILLSMQLLGVFYDEGTVSDMIEEAVESASEYAEDAEEDVQDEAEYEDEYVRPEPTDVHDKLMLSILDEACGNRIYKYVSVDMDRNGEREMIGITDDDGGYDYCIWYCSSDLESCYEVMQVQWYDDYDIDALELDEESHVVVNGFHMIGTGKSYSILALHDGQIEVLVDQNYGYVYMNNTNDIILDVEGYDMMYEKLDDLWLGHTWVDTYLYYEDGKYKEYGAATLSEKDFLKYDNAKELLDAIEEENGEENYIEIRYSYFIRENGIVHIQCEAESAEYIDYFHYTLRINGNHLDGELYKNPGIMYSSMSWLDEVTYPDS